MTDFNALRRTMVENQIRTVDVTDRALLAAFGKIAREDFVDGASREIAYLDRDVQCGASRFMIAPQSLARLLQLAAITKNEHVLDVGCARGYSTAIIAELAHSVIGIEEDEALIASAPQMPENARVLPAKLQAGFIDGGPYDVIVIQGAIEALPADFALQLAPRGRLVAVNGAGRSAKAMIYMNTDDGLSARTGFDIAVPTLPQFAARPAFRFAV